MFEPLGQLFARIQKTRFFARPDVIQLFFCLAIILFFCVLMIVRPLKRFEVMFLDTFFRERPAIAIDPSIVIIEIDEESIQAIGRWPWPWDYHAKMLELLKKWGAKAIVFNMIFKEATASFESDVLQKTLQNTRGVYFPVMLEAKLDKKFWVHALPILLESEGREEGWTHGTPALERLADAVGHINAEPDGSGVLRRVAPHLTARGETHTHLGVKVAYDQLIRDSRQKIPPPLPLDPWGHLMINWVGTWEQSFQRYPYADLVRSFQAMEQGRSPIVNPKAIQDKICLIGLTVQDLANFQVTPFEPDFPLMGVQANVLNSILTKQFVYPASLQINLSCLVLIGALVSLLFIHFRYLTSFLVGVILSGCWACLAFILFCTTGIWLYVFHPLLLILALFIFSMLYGHFVASRERARLFDLATKDGLTGLFVIRYFREVLNQVVRESQMRKKPLCVILIDIDNFKPINDTYGHQAGDKVLKNVARIIQSRLRSQRPFHEADFVARYGGEEFIIMLRNIELQDAAAKVAERIRRAVAESVFPWENAIIPVTISLGVSSRLAHETVPDPMVRRADEALYQAKRTGKNRVCVEASK